jgi:hypothetical protein
LRRNSKSQGIQFLQLGFYFGFQFFMVSPLCGFGVQKFYIMTFLQFPCVRKSSEAPKPSKPEQLSGLWQKKLIFLGVSLK